MFAPQNRPDAGAHSHSVQLLIHIFVIFIVLAQLGDKRSVGQCEQLRTLKEMQKATGTKQHKRFRESLHQPGYNHWDSREGHITLVERPARQDCSHTHCKLAIEGTSQSSSKTQRPLLT